MALAYHEGPAERNPDSKGISLTTLNRALAVGEHAVTLYIHLANQALPDGRVTITNEQLCDLSDLSRNTVRKYLGLMEDRGLIQTLQKGQWRGHPTTFTLRPNCRLPDNIVNFVTEKGSNTPHIVTDFTEKGSNAPIDSWHKEMEEARKGSNALLTEYVQGVNDSEQRGQRQDFIPPTPPSSKSLVNNTTTTGSSVVFTSPEYLARTPEVILVRKEYPKITDHLVMRSMRELQPKFREDPPKTPRAAASRAAKWLRSGEVKKIHDAWRREDPYHMAGVMPQ